MIERSIYYTSKVCNAIEHYRTLDRLLSKVDGTELMLFKDQEIETSDMYDCKNGTFYAIIPRKRIITLEEDSITETFEIEITFVQRLEDGEWLPVEEV